MRAHRPLLSIPPTDFNCNAVNDFCDIVNDLNRDNLVDPLTKSLTTSDLDSIFRNLRTRKEGRLRLHQYHRKHDLASWLVTVFLNTCRALRKGRLLSTNLIVATRFKFCTSPGSLDSLDLMMKVFDDEFSEEFMCLAVPLDRRPTNVVQRAKSDVSDWSQLVPDTMKLQCAQSYRQATTWQPPAICAVCSRRCSAGDGKHKTVRVVDTCTKLPLALEDLRLTNQYIISRVASTDAFQFGHPLLDNLMLAREGISRDEENRCFLLTICTHCHNALNSNKQSHIPKHSLKNSLYRGELHQEISEPG